MSDLTTSLLKEPCRVPGIDAEGQYPNTVVAVWTDPAGNLLVGFVDENGKTTVQRFVNLEFNLG